MPFEISIEQTFAASHQLRLPSGVLEPLHGHNWRVVVEVESESLDACDCVMDFHVLERDLAAILGRWHNRHLNDCEPFRGGVNPSAERVAETIARGLTIPPPARLKRVSVGEAPGCSARFVP